MSFQNRIDSETLARCDACKELFPIESLKTTTEEDGKAGLKLCPICWNEVERVID